VCESEKVTVTECARERVRESGDGCTLQSLALEYCGSFKRFMHVEAVGSRASAARLWGSRQAFVRLWGSRQGFVRLWGCQVGFRG